VCILLTCGDGKVDPNEACDDSNNRSGDGCPADCSAPCGDGVLDPTEVCDDGNTDDRDGCSADCKTLDSIFLVSPTSVMFAASEGGALPAPMTITVRFAYRGDQANIGFRPENPQPPWLSIMDGPSTDNTATFELQPLDTGETGLRETSVHVVVSHQDSTGLDTYDLPVAYDVEPSSLAVDADLVALAFTAPSGGALPLPRTVRVTFNGPSIAVTAAPPWVTVVAASDPTTSPASFTISINSTDFAAGAKLSGDIAFSTSAGTITRRSTTSVTYDLLAFVPEIRFVAPYLGIAGRAGTLRVRGRGFLAAGGKATIAIGDLHVGPVSPDSDTQVTLSYPALPEGRYPVTLVEPQGIGPLNAELVVVAPPPFTYQVIAAPGPRRRLVYDAERQVMYGVNRPRQQLDRFAYTGGAWSALAPHIIPQLTDIAMSPNGRTLIVLDQDAISEASLTGDPLVLVAHAAIPDPLCGAFFDQAIPANNGKIFVVIHLTECADTGIPEAYLYDTLDHSMRVTTEFYRGLAGGSADGSRVYIGDSGLPHAFPVMIFDALNNTVSGSVVDLDLTAVTVSGDASRVILQNRFVYNRALTLTGNLPPSGVVLASRDSSRAFVYVEDTAGQRLEVYNLNGPLQSGALYPLLHTIELDDAANSGSGPHPPVTMTSSLDDDTVFISGDGKLLVVPAGVPAE
jgi:cysteine-rich repeat protein